ncbi:MAG: alpha-E domain-containing protein [Oscillospiraceae bacterium]
MGNVALSKCSCLFWLGRYTERVFTTLNTFFKYYDNMIDKDPEVYKKYLAAIGVPDTYKGKDDFLYRYAFDMKIPDSIISNLERALGNGIVLRQEIKSSSLSYLQLAIDKMKNSIATTMFRYDLMFVHDNLYAFWGCIENNMTDDKAKNIIYLGKAIERLDLFVRLEYPVEDLKSAFAYLSKHISAIDKAGYGESINRIAYEGLEKEINKDCDVKKYRNEMINNIEKLFEVKKGEEVLV